VIRVLHCDDSLAYRRLVRALLETEPDIEYAGEADDHAGAVRAAAEIRPDVLLLDMVVGAQREDLAAALAQAAPGVRVLILSGHPAERADPALRELAVGHVQKATAMGELPGAIRAATAGDSTNVR
jgi:DNA-binding NarL/FixJ family response regulator